MGCLESSLLLVKSTALFVVPLFFSLASTTGFEELDPILQKGTFYDRYYRKMPYDGYKLLYLVVHRHRADDNGWLRTAMVIVSSSFVETKNLKV